MAEKIEIGVTVPFERIIELALEIVLEAMRGQTAEQKAKMWDHHIAFVDRMQKVFGIKES